VGWLSFPEMAEVLIRSVRAVRADLVAVTGDLVQRAHRWQYKRAVTLLESFDTPLLTVPGNHDLYSWIYRPWMRIAAPLGRYKRYMGSNLSPTWEGPGVSVLGLNTATPWTIQRGRCTAEHSQRIEQHFGVQPRAVFKVLAIHHPLTDEGLSESRDVAKGGRSLLKSAARAGVDLILCGHWHLSMVQEIFVEGHRIIVALAGTASSGRYRAPQEGLNAYDVITLDTGKVVIEAWHYSRAAATFKMAHRHAFDRLD